jgi:hypothetical protein
MGSKGGIVGIFSMSNRDEPAETVNRPLVVNRFRCENARLLKIWFWTGW